MTIATLKAAIEAKKLEVSEKQQELDAFEYEATESEYDEFLDLEGPVSVGNMEFYPSDIIKKCDPTAYRCGKADYESQIDLNGVEEYRDLYSELEELESELEDLESELEDAEAELEHEENKEDFE